MTHDNRRHRRRQSAAGRPGRVGFTLTELLVVIGLITLIITIAIPAFSVITGGRSIDAAQNQVSAMLGRARADAIGLQEPRGVVFSTDQNTGRVVLAEVYFDQPSENLLRLELLPDRDELVLPAGVGGQVLADTGNFIPTGVILFDGSGRLIVRAYNLGVSPPTQFDTRLRRRFEPLPDRGTSTGSSNFGFALYDLDGYGSKFPVGSTPSANDLREWMAGNAVPFLINRYNGTLIRAE